MSKATNGTKEAAVLEATDPVAAIDKRLEALRAQEHEATQQVQLWTTKRIAAQGAIAMLQGLKEELEGGKAG